MKLKMSIVFLGMVMALPAQAAWWVGSYSVRYIEVVNDRIYFALNEAGSVPYEGMPDLGTCNYGVVTFMAADSAIDQVLAVALSAQASGAKVKFFITGCQSYVIATRIAIDPDW